MSARATTTENERNTVGEARYVVVTTAHRGVFAGVLESHDGDGAVLTDASMCVYWPSSVKGVLGLAVTGPLEGSRVGPAVPRIELHGVTAVMDASEEAEKAWRAAPWA